MLFKILKKKNLLKKYNNDTDIVGWILNHQIWLGQTKEQLKDSLGKPAAISQQMLKTKSKETWKYAKTGRNRFNLKVHLEDEEVVGWDKKS